MTEPLDGLRIEQAPGEDLPMELLLEADPSPSLVQGYLRTGTAWRVTDGRQTLAAAVLQPLPGQAWELMNIAVRPEHQGQGLGARLLQAVIAHARAQGARRLDVGTGAFGYPLTFYQRAGFRVVAVERDYFLRHYQQPLFEDGIQHKDRLMLSLPLP